MTDISIGAQLASALDLHLSFDDEFSGGLSVNNPSKGKTGVWNQWGAGTDSVYARTLQSNGEKELYVDPDFKGLGSTALGLNPYSVNNGVLSLTASPIPVADQAAAYGYKYQSGAITTQNTFAQTYGYFEARMKLPSGQGSWPAFWLMRQDGVWPPELDIMEAWNNSTAVQTVHSEQTGTHTMKSSSTAVAGGSDTFHTYGFLWTATTLTWYIDGTAVFSQPTPADMHSPMYMILDNAVSSAVSDPNYTSSLDIDYVRAYSLSDLSPGTGALSPDASITAATKTSASNTVANHPYWGAVAGEDDGFNAAYYAAHNPDVVAAGVDLLTHYLTYGKKEGRLPFDSGSDAGTPSAGVSIGTAGLVQASATAVSAANAAAASTYANPYYGQMDDNADGFNAAYYLAHNPDVAAAHLDPFYHYETYGKKEGRLPYDPTVTQVTTHAYWGAVSTQPDGFNAAYYAAHNPDVVLNGMDLLSHYETYGKKEGRLAYDPTATIATSTSAGSISSSTVASAAAASTSVAASTAATVTPAVTTVTSAATSVPATTTATATATATASTATATYYGKTAAQDGFNAAYYALHDPDVVAAGMDLLTHYEKYGKNEGRLAYDDGTGSETSTGTSGNDSFVASAKGDHVFTGAGGADTFTFVVGMGWDTITDFDVANDKLNLSALTTKYGAPTVSAIPWESGSMIHFAGNETVLLPGVSLANAQAAVAASIAAATGTTSTAAATYFGKTTAQDGFNAAYYALHDPDVVAAGMDLLTHYEKYGKNEGRLAYDDGSGKESTIGTSGNDTLVALASSHDQVLTGGGGSDTFVFKTGIGWDTITDFDVAHDKLDVSALTAKYGAPTVSAIPWESGSMIHFAGNETVLLLGVSVADAQHALHG